MLRVRVRNLGCPWNVASLGQKSDLVKLWSTSVMEGKMGFRDFNFLDPSVMDITLVPS